MSNHSGSHMLNAVLNVLDENNVFQFLGKEKTLKFLKSIRNIGLDYDCNDGEVLDEIGEKLKVCYTCWDYSDFLEDGICNECRTCWKR